MDHRSRPPQFESRRGHTWTVLHLWLRFITVWGRSARLAYHVQKSGRKTRIIIIWYCSKANGSQFTLVHISRYVCWQSSDSVEEFPIYYRQLAIIQEDMKGFWRIYKRSIPRYQLRHTDQESSVHCVEWCEVLSRNTPVACRDGSLN